MSQMTPVEILQEKVASLQSALLASHPTMPVLLRDIHQNLKADPAIVTVLSEEEIGIIVQGLQKITNVKIMELVSKKGTGKALKKTTVADL